MRKKVLLTHKDILETYVKNISKNKLHLLNSRKWLPIQIDSPLTKECAYLIGKIMGDGNLDPTFTCRFVGEYNDLKVLFFILREKFGIEENRISIRKKIAYGESYLLQVNDALLGRLLFVMGAPLGNKTKQKSYVPEWIKESKLNARYFLKALLEDELSTIKIEKNTHANYPRLKLAKRKEFLPNLRSFLDELRMLVENLGVECSQVSKNPTQRKERETFELYFKIKRNKKNIINFKRNIGFRINKTKIQNLMLCYKIIKKSLK